MKESNIIKKYLLFFLCFMAVFSICSFALDLIFSYMDYGSISDYLDRKLGAIIYYGIFIVIWGFPLSIILIPLYNFIINQIERGKHVNIIRILVGLAIGLFLGQIINYGMGNFYIGKYRPLKVQILYPLVAVILEIIRIYVVGKRYSSKVENNSKLIEQGY